MLHLCGLWFCHIVRLRRFYTPRSVHQPVCLPTVFVNKEKLPRLRLVAKTTRVRCSERISSCVLFFRYFRCTPANPGTRHSCLSSLCRLFATLNESKRVWESHDRSMIRIKKWVRFPIIMVFCEACWSTHLHSALKHKLDLFSFVNSFLQKFVQDSNFHGLTVVHRCIAFFYHVLDVPRLHVAFRLQQNQRHSTKDGTPDSHSREKLGSKQVRLCFRCQTP